MHFLKWKWNFLFGRNDQNGKRWPSEHLIPKLCWHNHVFLNCEKYMLLGEEINLLGAIIYWNQRVFFPSILWHWKFGTIFQIMRQVSQFYTLKFYQKLHNILGKNQNCPKKTLIIITSFLCLHLFLSHNPHAKHDQWIMSFCGINIM